MGPLKSQAFSFYHFRNGKYSVAALVQSTFYGFSRLRKIFFHALYNKHASIIYIIAQLSLKWSFEAATNISVHLEY